MLIKDLRCEYRTNPLGIDILQPRLSWKMVTIRRGANQRAYQVIAASSIDALLQANSILWNSSKVDSSASTQIIYGGSPLQSRQRVYWRVRVWDETDQPTEWSNPAWFELGLLNQMDWQAHWIGNSIVGDARKSAPCPFFRNDFSIEGDIAAARLYITSLGLYDSYINGQRVGDDVFSPGWTDYQKRVQYHTYDVANLLTEGPNAIGVILGDGWYCGHVAWSGRQLYGDRPKLLAQLEITYIDGTTQVIVTNDIWETAVGPLLEADLIMGEVYDARLELKNWNLPISNPTQQTGRVDQEWSSALTFPHPDGLNIVAQNTTPVCAHEELTPIDEPSLARSESPPLWIYDFGQNLVGRIRLKIKGGRGTVIRLRFGEMLDEHKMLYTENLRSARQTDYYTLKGDPDGEIWESRFTFHGFQYVELSGHTHKPEPDALTAVVLHSVNPPTIEFECSDTLINQLQHNINWGWKGNSLDVPTDCPQRDERLGWTGDAQVFAKTATYLTDSASFFTKWMQDLADAQFDYGAIPSYAPTRPTKDKFDGGAAWSDAIIIVPWTIWQQYGETRLIETYYPEMCLYMDYLVENSPGLIRMLPDEKELGPENKGRIGGYGDWLAQDGSSTREGLTPRELIGTAFLAYDAKLMSQIAAVIGKTTDAAKFDHLFENTRATFNKHFITPDGVLAGQTQTGFILALHFNLVPEELRSTIADALVKDIENRGLHMSTGFVGTPYICQVLTDIGRVDLAYKLLFQKSFPSWLYSVLHGATTIWERWDGWTAEKGFHDPSMNSFNHYAYGAVGTWMYENITGICTHPKYPGFKHFVLQPKIGGGLTYARCIYHSPYGQIKSHWQIEDGTLIWDVIVPPNTTAIAHIPAEAPSQILEGSGPIEDSPDAKFIRQTPETVVYELKSGSYHFTIHR